MYRFMISFMVTVTAVSCIWFICSPCDHSLQTVCTCTCNFGLVNRHRQSDITLSYLVFIGAPRVLCIDSSDRMAMLQLEVLHQIEQGTGRRICNLFDWIAAGGITAVLVMAMIYGKTGTHLPHTSYLECHPNLSRQRLDFFLHMYVLNTNCSKDLKGAII